MLHDFSTPNNPFFCTFFCILSYLFCIFKPPIPVCNWCFIDRAANHARIVLIWEYCIMSKKSWPIYTIFLLYKMGTLGHILFCGWFFMYKKSIFNIASPYIKMDKTPLIHSIFFFLLLFVNTFIKRWDPYLVISWIEVVTLI